jgi:polar amino acid transport system substrate-binding protein
MRFLGTPPLTRYEHLGPPPFIFAIVCDATKARGFQLQFAAKRFDYRAKAVLMPAAFWPLADKKKTQRSPTERISMRISNLLAAASLAALSLFAGSAMADGEKLVIGTDSTYPPFEFVDASGEIKGFDIDIAKALCAEMKAECSFVSNDWDGIIPALQAKKFDMIVSSMSITPERSKLVDFTNKYYNTPPAIAVPKDSTITDVAGLKGKTIGAQTSTTHANYAEKHLADTELKLYPTADEYKLDVSNGRIDAVIDDVVVLSQWVKSDAGACCKILTTLPVDKEINGIGAGIAVRQGDPLKDKLNTAIAAIRANGKYKEIQDKYFDFNVYGD